MPLHIHGQGVPSNIIGAMDDHGPRVDIVTPVVTPARSRRALTESEDATIRDLVRQLVAKEGSQVAVAMHLGLKQPTISSYLAGRFTAGYGFARSVAAAYSTSLPRLFGWDDDPEDATDPFPNRGKAITAARAAELDERAIERLRKVGLAAGERDPAPRWWLTLALRYDEEERGPKLL